MIVRTATSADAAGVAALRLAWASERSDAAEPAETYAAALADWIEAHRETVVGKVAVADGGALAGMAWLAIVDRLPVPTRHARRSGDIQSVFVDPAHRGDGLGRMLIDALLDEARARMLDRVVLHSTTVGADFYRRLGWTNSELLLEIVP